MLFYSRKPFETVVTNGCLIFELLLSEVPTVEMEPLKLQKYLVLKEAHTSPTTSGFWKQISEVKHTHLNKTSIRVISVLRIKYCCESFYSAMKFVKSKYRITLTNQDLKELSERP